MNQPSISAQFTGDGSQIRQEIGKIGKGLQDLGKGGSKDVESIGAAFKGLKSSFMEINSASEVVRKAFSMLAGAVDFLAEGEKVGNFAKAFSPSRRMPNNSMIPLKNTRSDSSLKPRSSKLARP
jgi:hypothetical protein